MYLCKICGFNDGEDSSQDHKTTRRHNPENLNLVLFQSYSHCQGVRY
jgi:hypothetical protein